MNSFARACVVVVASESSSCSLIQSLRRMGVATVLGVPGLEQARRLCHSGRVDACLVVLPRPVPDELPPLRLETGAPGRGTNIPSLLLADAITPYLLKTAGRAGYLAAIPAAIAPRRLYRCLGGLLQQSRRLACRSGGSAAELEELADPASAGAPRTLAFVSTDPGKLKLQ